MEIWSSMHRGERGADALADAQLHRERLDLPLGTRRLHAMSVASLPDGAFVLRDGTPFAVVGSRLLRWTPSGYAQHLPRATRGRIAVVTPPSIVEVLRRGWEPDVPSCIPPPGHRHVDDRGTVGPGGPVRRPSTSVCSRPSRTLGSTRGRAAAWWWTRPSQNPDEGLVGSGPPSDAVDGLGRLRGLDRHRLLLRWLRPSVSSTLGAAPGRITSSTPSV